MSLLFKKKLDIYIKQCDNSIENIKSRAKEINDLQIRVHDFEDIIKINLKTYKRENLIKMQEQILGEINIYNKNRDFLLIIDQKNILYSDADLVINLTDTIMNIIKNKQMAAHNKR
jgi:hypothetical protein